MTYMTDTGRTAAFLNYALDGASAPTITQPYMLRLTTAAGSGNGNVNGSNGTQLSGSGYTAGGSTLGSSAPFGSFSATAPSGSNANSVTWNATGTWTTVTGIEIWDSAGTALRWFQGPVTSPISGVVNGDSVQFGASAVTLNSQAW